MPGAVEAVTLTELGFRVFPLEPQGKRPLTPNGCKDATRDNDVIRAWWDRWPDANIGVATGPGSDLYIIDIDGPDAEAAWQRLAQDGDDDTLTVSTSRGRHLYYRCTDPLPNTASRIAPGIDTRGNGGYVVAPPSIHPSGVTYEFVAARLPRDLPGWIRGAVTPKTTSNGGDPTMAVGHPARDAYAKSTLTRLYEAVTKAGEGTRNDTLNRAAYSAGQLISGGILEEPDVEMMLHAASSAAGLDAAEAHATIRSGINAGMANPWTPEFRAERDDTTGASGPAATAEGDAQEAEEPVRASSWQPIDIIAAADTPPPEPSFYGGLIYPGARHLISGEPETMKSWLALAVAHQVASDLGRVIYINTDGAPDWDIAQRLRAIGLTDEEIRRNVTLISPAEPPGPNDIQELADTKPDLVILDTLDPAAELIDADTNSSKDTMRTIRTYITPFFRTGASILILDHVVKDPESRGRYSSGSGRKLGEVEVHIGLKLVGPPLTREGGDTRIQITVHKDRLAGIRRGGHGSFGHIEWHATPGGTRLVATVHPNSYTDSSHDEHRLTHLMQKISEVLEIDGELNTNQIINSIDGHRKESIRKAIKQLRDDEHIEGKDGPNRSVRYRVINPYREDQE